jgi:WS/DGAT/MGAT family acyltransferase
VTYTHYDRLSALDAAFLDIEDASAHMHIGSVGIFETGPLKRPEGGIDIAAIRDAAGAALRRNPRFRQRLSRVPLLRQPIWVDDEKFNLDYHLRHTCLPAPGDLRQLKRLAGRILSQQLDRGKPLWEMWFVEGLEADRFAVISKIHHCIADGISGVDLLGAFMGRDPEHRAQTASRWIPRAAPGPARLVADELSRRARLPLSLASAGARAAASTTSCWRWWRVRCAASLPAVASGWTTSTSASWFR